MRNIGELKKLRVGGVDYRIKHVNKLTHPDAQGLMLDGLVEFGKATLSLKSSQSEQAKAVALIHEMIHVWFQVSGVSEQDEGIVNSMSYAVLGTIRDNPEIFRRIARMR